MKKLLLFTFIDAFGWELLQKKHFSGRLCQKQKRRLKLFSVTAPPVTRRFLQACCRASTGIFRFLFMIRKNHHFKTARMLSLLPISH
jgi:hypothetical protein